MSLCYINQLKFLFQIDKIIKKSIQIVQFQKFLLFRLFFFLRNQSRNSTVARGKHPTKHLCILVPAPFWHYQFSAVVQIMNYWCYLGKFSLKSGANLALKFSKILLELHLFWTNLMSNVSTIFNARLALYNANKVQI